MRFIALGFIAAALAGCSAGAPQWTKEDPHAAADAAPPVSVALFPTHFKRPFFSTMQISGHTVSAVGQLNVKSPYDLRLTAASELGSLLFDARYNWAGLHVQRADPRFPPDLAVAILNDLSHALRLPRSVDGAQTDNGLLVLRKIDGENYPKVYCLTPAGTLLSQDIRYATFDTLHIAYRQYSAEGAPGEILLSRPSKNYSLILTFTDSSLARKPGGMAPEQ